MLIELRLSCFGLTAGGGAAAASFLARGGLLGTTLSWIFCAVLAVGLVSLARKSPPGDLEGAAAVVREVCRSLEVVLLWTGRDARGTRLVVVDEVEAEVEGARDERGARVVAGFLSVKLTGFVGGKVATGLEEAPLIFVLAPFCCSLFGFSVAALVSVAVDVKVVSKFFGFVPLVLSFGDCFVACEVLGFGKPVVDSFGDGFELVALVGAVGSLGLLVVCGDFGCSLALTSDTVLGWDCPVLVTVLSCGCLSCGKKLLSAALCCLVTSEPIGILGDPELLLPFVVAGACFPETTRSVSSAGVFFVPPGVPSKEEPFSIEPSPPSTEVSVICRA